MTTVSVKATPKEVFLQLLSIITLYASAISFTVLIFQYINVLVPDPLGVGGYYDTYGARQAIRWSIAVLMVVFPVYAAVGWFLNKEYVRHPEKRNIRIRKWLLYFTLFVAALIIIGDLVTLIYNLLGGELTFRFFLKMLTILFVAGSIFGYYLFDIRKHHTE